MMDFFSDIFLNMKLKMMKPQLALVPNSIPFFASLDIHGNLILSSLHVTLIGLFISGGSAGLWTKHSKKIHTINSINTIRNANTSLLDDKNLVDFEKAIFTLAMVMVTFENAFLTCSNFVMVNEIEF
jgi:hypothetical protein